MEIQPVVPPPQNPGGGAGALPPAVDTVTISKSEYDDLSHRAGVSSQNFERLKDAEKALEQARNLLSANNTPTPDPEVAKKITDLEAVVSDLTSKLTKSELIERNPILKDSWQDFETFRQDPANTGMNMATAAEVFMARKGLLTPQRPGIERPTGGPRIPPTTGMTSDEVKKLRETDYRKYSEMLKNGQIQISE